MHKSNSLITQHRRLRIRGAELDTTLQDFVVKLLDRKLFLTERGYSYQVVIADEP